MYVCQTLSVCLEKKMKMDNPQETELLSILIKDPQRLHVILLL
mgnify:CR=1 FL=1|jgi:hypothetical protein